MMGVLAVFLVQFIDPLAYLGFALGWLARSRLVGVLTAIAMAIFVSAFLLDVGTGSMVGVICRFVVYMLLGLAGAWIGTIKDSRS